MRNGTLLQNGSVTAMEPHLEFGSLMYTDSGSVSYVSTPQLKQEMLQLGPEL